MLFLDLLDVNESKYDTRKQFRASSEAEDSVGHQGQVEQPVSKVPRAKVFWNCHKETADGKGQPGANKEIGRIQADLATGLTPSSRTPERQNLLACCTKQRIRVSVCPRHAAHLLLFLAIAWYPVFKLCSSGSVLMTIHLYRKG